MSSKKSNEKKKDLWEEIITLKAELTLLRQDLNKPTPDYEAEAKQASKKASEYRNRSLDAKESADSALSEITCVKNSVDELYAELSLKRSEAQSILDTCDNANESVGILNENAVKLDTLLLKYDEYAAQVDSIHNHYIQGEETSSKINLLYESISKKKKNVDDVYIKIFGYDEDNKETGEVKFIGGLKEELDNSYSELNKSIEDAQIKIRNIEKETAEENNNFLLSQEERIIEKIGEWDITHSATSKKVTDLLPDALTAGLSHAFSEKRKSEIDSGIKLGNAFSLSILGLVLVSLIPFAVNAYFLHIGKGLEDVIRDLPRLLTSIIPLYIPLVWLAYSSNKKANLSKRLVEEYTHKEVLSKTFEGLSSQIASIEEDSISAELRVKLLYNLLDVSAENPGKLISNYNTSDHPLIDALEASSKLGENVKKLDKIPGLNKISHLLEKRAARLLKEQNDNITDALEHIDK